MDFNNLASRSCHRRSGAAGTPMLLVFRRESLPLHASLGSGGAGGSGLTWVASVETRSELPRNHRAGVCTAEMQTRIRPIAWRGSRVQSSLKPACILWLQTHTPLVKANPSFFPDNVTPVASQPEVIFFLGRDQGCSVRAGLWSRGEVLPPRSGQSSQGAAGGRGGSGSASPFLGVCKGGKRGDTPSGKDPEDRGWSRS